MYNQEKRSWLKHIDFMIIDLIGINMSLLVAYMFRNNGINTVFGNDFWKMVVIISIIDLVTVFFTEGYSGIVLRGYLQELKAVILHVCVTLMGFILFGYLTKTNSVYSRFVVVMTWELAIFFCYFGRIIRKKMLRRKMLAGQLGFKSMVALVESKEASEFVEKVCKNNYSDKKLTGIILLDKDMKGESIHGVPVVAGKDDAVIYMCQNWVDEVITIYPKNNENAVAIIDDCREMGISVHIVLMESGYGQGRHRVENIGEYTVMSSYLTVATNRQAFMKRFMDICGGLVGCIATLILMIFVAPMIWIKSPGPIFFSQVRVGKNGKRFKIYKFRSMYMDAEERKKELMEKNKIKDGMMFKMDDDPRIIKGIGHFIRKTSIDEFPQFLNVLKGDMSLVGTRPPTVDEWEKYKKHHRRRMAIKPGMTGMWQVSGRSDITDFEQVVALDTKYIMEWNISLDIKILCKTVMLLFTGRGSQ